MWQPTCPRWVHVGCRPSPGQWHNVLVCRKGPGHTPALHHWSEMKHDTKGLKKSQGYYLTRDTGHSSDTGQYERKEMKSVVVYFPTNSLHIFYCLNSFSATKHKLRGQCLILYSLVSSRDLSVVVMTTIATILRRGIFPFSPSLKCLQILPFAAT